MRIHVKRTNFPNIALIAQVIQQRPDGVVGYHVSLTVQQLVPIRSWDRAPVWSFLFCSFFFSFLL